MLTTMSSFDDHSCQGRGEKPRTTRILYIYADEVQTAHARELLISNLAHAYLASTNLSTKKRLSQYCSAGFCYYTRSS